jgi:peptidoglycan/xylan/chitin deacetylase (PgdA/CDA1 family)
MKLIILYHRVESKSFRSDMVLFSAYETRLLEDPLDGICVTFDDGTTDQYESYLHLEETGRKGEFFVITSKIGTEGFITWDQLREMSNAGMGIQSHTDTHRPLNELTDEEVETEMRVSMKRIKDEIGKAPKFISLPGGHYDERTPVIAQKCGYQGVRGSKSVFTNGKEDRWNMPVYILKHS